MNNICTGSACYSSASGCNAPCPHKRSSRDTTHTVLPKLNAWPETTIAQRNTEGHQSWSNNKGKTAQKHAVFVKPISCTDRWFHAILKTKDFFYTHSRAAFFKFYIPEPHFILSITFRTALSQFFISWTTLKYLRFIRLQSRTK